MREKEEKTTAKATPAKGRRSYGDTLKRIHDEDPERFARMHAQAAATFKETVRLERLRMVHGLPRRTRLKLCIVAMEPRQNIQKWRMRTRHNYFTIDDHPTWICHDKDTRRSARMEATAARYGLRVVEADDTETPGTDKGEKAAW